MNAKSPELFDPSSVSVDSPRLKLVKKHDIQTHHDPRRLLNPWVALPMRKVRELLDGHNDPESDLSTIDGITASLGKSLDDAGLTLFGGTSEEDVIDQALQWISQNQN